MIGTQPGQGGGSTFERRDIRVVAETSRRSIGGTPPRPARDLRARRERESERPRVGCAARERCTLLFERRTRARDFHSLRRQRKKRATRGREAALPFRVFSRAGRHTHVAARTAPFGNGCPSRVHFRRRIAVIASAIPLRRWHLASAVRSFVGGPPRPQSSGRSTLSAGSAFRQSLAQRVLVSQPQPTNLSPGLLVPSAHARLGSPLRRGHCRTRCGPPSGFDYPLGGFRLPRPGRPCFMPTALLGFTLRSFLHPAGTADVSARVNPHTVYPASIPSR